MQEEAGIPQTLQSEANNDDVTSQSSAGDPEGTPVIHTPPATDTISSCSDQELRDICSSMNNQMLDSPLVLQVRMPAILRFRQESQDRTPDPRSVPAQHAGDSPVLCEFCGETGGPFRDISSLSCTAELERFCCPQARHLVEDLAQEWRLLLETLDQGDNRAVSTAQPPTQEEELKHRAWEREERSHRQLERDLEQYYQAANSTILPTDSSAPPTRTISFQLSSYVTREAGKEVTQDSKMEEDLENREGDILTGPGVLGFGIIHKKDNMEFREKYYSHGNKFLTVFADGSAQVFYPSGHLALLITMGDSQEDMVCIVQDDHTSAPPIRALFQSNGRATCYHSNGGIWMSMDISGGQCSDERGTRIRQWHWSEHQDTPTPLRPLFLSLNQSVGVRVLGRERIFVTFLAKGCQARFSVGTCVQFKDESSSSSPRRPSVNPDEVFLLAGRLRLHRAFGRLHNCLRFPSNPRLLRAKPPPSLISLAKGLLALSQRLQMEERDRAYILACLQDCL